MSRVNVKELRDRTGLTAQRLADHLGVHIRTVHRWESREVDPSPLAMKQLRELDRQHQHRAHETDDEQAASSPRRPSGLLPSSQR